MKRVCDPRREKPRQLLDFDDGKLASILIKRVVRDAKGRVVEDILPKHAESTSGSESTSSDSIMVVSFGKFPHLRILS